jgi:hypothetical protein
MAEHYTRNTVWVTAWCKKCEKNTPHSTSGVRKGPCLICIERLEKEHERLKAAPKQDKLF